MKSLSIAFIFSTMLLTGCAFTDAQLPVEHHPDQVKRGPLSELDSVRFLAITLNDQRSDKQRIGWKKNGYGQQTADITTEKTVTLIVQNALRDGLNKNGHSVATDGLITLQGSVDRFWFEIDANFWDVEFIGEVKSHLQFVDRQSGQTIYASDYHGTHSEKKLGGLEETWKEVMSTAVDKLVEDVVFDDDLVDALETWRKNQSP